MAANIAAVVTGVDAVADAAGVIPPTAADAVAGSAEAAGDVAIVAEIPESISGAADPAPAPAWRSCCCCSRCFSRRFRRFSSSRFLGEDLCWCSG